ncbi:MAG: hypothetical protein DYG98_10810 [Haliscomenobacteraceae bacterium CHB4]|nr:hypothetical protein [Saprospiraceae bacterium]MCE7923540.1 hypothetical protein [Haliscomenobacteraceae bacterium CHB4]
MTMKDDLPQMQPIGPEEGELTLRELLLKIRGFYLEMRQNWKIVLLCILLSCSAFLINAWLTKPKFPAQLTFMVREDSKSGLSGVASLLGQFGFGGGSSGEFNLDKITELAKSRHIVQAALFDSATINGKKDYLANHIIDIHNIQKQWRKDTLLRDFRFTRAHTEFFDRRENKALITLHQKMVSDKSAFLTAGYSKQTSILNIKVSAQNEELSIALANALYRRLSEFYIEQSTAQSRQTVRNLEVRTDSIRAILTASERSFARTEDRTLGLLLKEDKVPQKRLGTDIQILNLMYAEAIKNLETASFLLKNSTPIFMEIDRPLAPIKPVGASKKIALALGMGLGFLVAAVWIFGRKLLRNAFTDNSAA